MTRAERASAYKDGFVGKEVTWGEDDCCMFVARWVEQESGAKLALPAYTTKEAAHALIDEAGSLDGLWRRIADDAGFMETGEPEVGDVCVIETARFGQVGVIMMENGVCYWRETKGVTLFQPRPGKIVAAWHVPETAA